MLNQYIRNPKDAEYETNSYLQDIYWFIID